MGRPYIYNISTREAEAGGSLSVQSQPDFHVKTLPQSIQSFRPHRMEGISIIRSACHRVPWSHCVTQLPVPRCLVFKMEVQLHLSPRTGLGGAESPAQAKGLGTGPVRFQILRRPRTAVSPKPARKSVHRSRLLAAWPEKAPRLPSSLEQATKLMNRAANYELQFPGGREQSGRAWKGCS